MPRQKQRSTFSKNMSWGALHISIVTPLTPNSLFVFIPECLLVGWRILEIEKSRNGINICKR